MAKEYMHVCKCGYSDDNDWTTKSKEGETCPKCDSPIKVFAVKKPLVDQRLSF